MTVCIADLDGSQYFLPLQPNNICPNSPGKFYKAWESHGVNKCGPFVVKCLVTAEDVNTDICHCKTFLSLSPELATVHCSLLMLPIYHCQIPCDQYPVHQPSSSHQPRVNGPVQSHLRLAWESVSLLHLGTVPYIACRTVILWVWRCSGTDDLSQGPSLLQTREQRHYHSLPSPPRTEAGSEFWSSSWTEY